MNCLRIFNRDVNIHLLFISAGEQGSPGSKYDQSSSEHSPMHPGSHPSLHDNPHLMGDHLSDNEYSDNMDQMSDSSLDGVPVPLPRSSNGAHSSHINTESNNLTEIATT